MKTFIFLSSNGEVCHALLAPAAKLAKRSVRRANVLVVMKNGENRCGDGRMDEQTIFFGS